MDNKNVVSYKRLIRDLRSLSKSNIKAYPVNEDIYSWFAYINGAENSIWEYGIFKLKITFPQNYPTNPPEVQFVSKIFHPNVYNDGKICLDILSNNWSPIYDVENLLLSIEVF